jgi:subtilisin family serine protease
MVLMMSKRVLVFLSLSLSAFSGFAQVADNQKILTADRAAIVNPVPTERDFVEINKKHELLIAVIDTGVDYNHPLLKDNIHFQLGQNGKPIRLGWDFTANDAWPAPLIAKSADLDRTAPVDVINSEKAITQGLQEFSVAYPDYALQMDSQRQIVQELSASLFHGTHVAGLMVYDEPRIGLLAYRALPFNLTYAQGQPQIADSEDNVPAAIRKAIEDGARVINMSLGTSLNKEVQSEDPKYYEQQERVMAEIKKIALANPQVAFVAASGNEGAWIDDKSRQGLPCGINSKNILCVGALGTDGEVASFSNIVLPDYPFIMAPGEDILSLFPSQFCPVPGFFIQGLGQLSAVGASQKTFFFKSLAEYCKDSGQLYSSSGTSMASPIVARVVAKAMLANPQLSGAEAIQKVLSDSVGGTIGRLNVKKLRIEKPSWYPKSQTLPLAKAFGLNLDLKMSAQIDEYSEPEFFEFYTK